MSSSRSRRCRSTSPPAPISLLIERAGAAWDRALAQGELYGYRNAQVTVVAPTGTIGLVMDCDTTGIEPDFALVKFKKLAGGGYLKIVNRAVPEGLRSLGYRESEIAEIEAYAVGHASLSNAPAINTTSLRAKGFTDEKIAAVEGALRSAFDIKFVFNKWTLGQDFLTGVLKVPAAALDDKNFDLLTHLGFSRAGHRRRECPYLRRDDSGRRAAFEARALSGVRLRQSLRAHRQALSPGRLAYPHDGGGAALHLGRDQQDHQHAE